MTTLLKHHGVILIAPISSVYISLWRISIYNIYKHLPTDTSV